jgi:hypothetical protein
MPRGVKSFVEEFMFAGEDKRNGKLIFVFGAIFWTLWLNRNDLVFNKKIISSPNVLIFKFVSFYKIGRSRRRDLTGTAWSSLLSC